MNDQSKEMKLLYTLFLLAVTARTVIALYDRFFPKNAEYGYEKKDK